MPIVTDISKALRPGGFYIGADGTPHDANGNPLDPISGKPVTPASAKPAEPVAPARAFTQPMPAKPVAAPKEKPAEAPAPAGGDENAGSAPAGDESLKQAMDAAQAADDKKKGKS